MESNPEKQTRWEVFKASLFKWFKTESFTKFLRTILKDWLKSKAFKTLVKKALGSTLGGFKTWIIAYIVTEFYDEIAKPMIDYGLRRAGYYIDSVKGEKVLRRIEDAENSDEWRDSVNDV